MAISSVHKSFEKMHMILVEKEKNGFKRHVLKDCCSLGNKCIALLWFCGAQVGCLSFVALVWFWSLAFDFYFPSVAL